MNLYVAIEGILIRRIVRNCHTCYLLAEVYEGPLWTKIRRFVPSRGIPRDPQGSPGNPQDPPGTLGNPREPAGTLGIPQDPWRLLG